MSPVRRALEFLFTRVLRSRIGIALVIAAAIVAVLVVAARDVFGRLLDRVDEGMVEHAHAVLAARPGVRAVRRVRMRWIGHRLAADIELDVDPDLSLTAAHALAHDAEHQLAHAIPKLDSAVVHAYPGHRELISS